MFEYLDNLRSDLKPMFGRLVRLNRNSLEIMKQKYPDCPDSYWVFMSERGYGALEQDGEPFFFTEGLLSAETELYRDRQIYAHGAMGDIMIFGYESMGTAYGFDTGDNWKMVEVDEYRIVTLLGLNFEQFVTGLVLCYPQIALKVENGIWIDGVGVQYKLVS